MARKDPQIQVRLPVDVRDWIALQSKRNACSQSSEIVRSIRERMDRDAAVRRSLASAS
ncbi:MAG: Arc family DNA-binding protein [Alphaproteobacteria bacterium]|nr:Arc family DNA-binding protein [Alphaproteobacteria bacterium]